jgi:dihydrofolate synthase/folylpolyglutamate synthase
MTYQETTEWMFRQLPMYQNIGASAYKEDLTNALLLAKHLGNPERKIKCIHVAGTNGKGSTSHFLASILQEAGYKVGLYTSPHLKDFRERIKINGFEITEEVVCDFITKNKPFLENHSLSFFEMTVGLAFEYFANEAVDFAIIEVGLGGRLDATNIIMPLVSVITNIGLDHVQFLGNTEEAIAREKAGIIKPQIPLVIGEYTPETQPVFLNTAKEKEATIYFASDLIATTFPSDLKGNYQEANKKTVLQTIAVLKSKYGYPISEATIQKAFLNTIKNTGLQGRWQQIHSSPMVICDTAHNKHGLEVTLKQLQDQTYNQLHLVVGFVNDKNLDEILPLFPKNAIYYFCKPNNSRGLPAEITSQKAKEFGLFGEVYPSVSKAYQVALQKASATDVIYIGGSNFVVAEII